MASALSNCRSVLHSCSTVILVRVNCMLSDFLYSDYYARFLFWCTFSEMLTLENFYQARVLGKKQVNCNTLSNKATHCNALQRTATHCNALQRTATHCNALRHTATQCNTSQHAAIHYNTQQLNILKSALYSFFSKVKFSRPLYISHYMSHDISHYISNYIYV